MDPLSSTYKNAIHSTHAYIAHFRVSTSSYLRTVQATQKSFTVNTAIRIDNVNPTGVYFFTHALTTYPRLHDMYSTTFKRKPSDGVGYDLTNHASLSSRFIAYSGSIRKEIQPGCRSRPQTM